MRGRLLVVAPHGTRTGSTRVLLGLLARIAPQLSVPLAVEVRSGGPWAPDLQAFGAPLGPGERPAAVFVNSSLAADAIGGFAPGTPALVYVHEVAGALALLPEASVEGLRRAQRVLVVSEAGAQDVVALGVDPHRVAVVPPLVVPSPPVDALQVASVRRELDLAPDARLVVGCGEASERKGTDLFVELAAHLAPDPTIHLAWIGRRLRAAARVLDHDVQVSGLDGRITWLDDRADPAPLLAAADVLAMTSREDPQPLVPLEAAFQGTPTVAFDVGGLRDLATEGAACSVPFPDTEALAGAVRALLDAPVRGAEVVASATARAAARQGPEAVVPLVLGELEALLATSAGS
jgi:glycosyltransferase involved in cell wall biosynthesis